MIIRKWLALGWLGILLLAMAAGSVSAYGYSVVEDDVEVRMDYPIEMKIGSCYTITFWMKASENLTDLTVVLTLYYHADSSANPLYSQTIISEDSVEVGWTKSKTIQVCIPDTRPRDPYVRSELQLYYTVNDTEKTLSYEWYMAIVRSQTYQELESEIDDLQDEINDLKNEVNQLKDQLQEKEEALKKLQESYEDLLSSYSSLTEKYQQAKAELESLNEDYQNLEKSYQALEDEHQATVIELEKLRSKYEMLTKNYGSLEERYQSLLSDYQTTLSELNTYKTMYLDLKSRHEDLQSRHNDLIAEAASLRQKIADLEQDYGELNRIYQATLGESSLTKNLLFAQTAAVIAGVGIYALLSRRFMRHAARPGEAPVEGNGEKRVQKVLSGRRVTIPSEVASKLGLKEGDQVEVDYGNGAIIIKPVKEVEEKPVEKRETSGESNSAKEEEK